MDFFINNADDFKQQVEIVIQALSKNNFTFQISVADVSFARIFVNESNYNLKVDFVNDVAFREGLPHPTTLYRRTDTVLNILSNKISALGRYAAKDIVDIVFISKNFDFDWTKIFSDAAKKDMWVNPVEVSKILDEFPLKKLDEIFWTGEAPDYRLFDLMRKQIIVDILQGNQNSLYST